MNPVPSAVTTQTLDMCIRAEVLGGTWETYGVDRAIDVDPETLSLTFNEWGPDTASFVLRRSPWASWPDLQPYTPIEVEIGGVVAWEGRTSKTPLKAGAEQQISIQGEGWQYSLDDDLYRQLYVHSTLTDWKDFRSIPTANLAAYVASPQIQAQQGSIVITYPASVPAAGSAAVVLDLGVADAARVLTIQWALTAGAANRAFYYGSSETLGTEAPQTATIYSSTAAGGATTVVAVSGRYVYLRFDSNSHTPTSDETLKITSVAVFGSSAYESAGSSVLKAATVVESALTAAAPLISTDLSQIASEEDEYDIPSLVMANYRTPREMIEAVNAFHDWTTKIDLARRMVFAPRPTEALLEFGSWSGEEIEDTSAGEGAEIYDKVIVEGTEADGTPLNVPVTGARNVISERGFTRAKAVPVQNVLTQGVAERLGEIYLDAHEETPFAGSLKATVGSVRNVQTGQPVHPSQIGRHVQELLRVSHMIDPNTGGVGRDGLMVGVSYSHADQTAEVTLGNRLDNFSVVLARLAVAEEVSS